MSDLNSGWTRRRFLQAVGLAGGSAALYDTMTAMGLIRIPDAWAGPPRLPQGLGTGTRVLILGAGIGGLTAAYELTRAGFQCEILEAQNRAGGRSLTARRGTILTEESLEHGLTQQECQFDDGLYLNAGPGRLPHHHRRVLHYCQELGVALEVYIMETTANLFQSDQAFGGRPQTNRSIANDTRGYIAELLAKSIHRHALDEELNEGDRDNLLSLLQVFGDLGDDKGAAIDPCDPFAYCGSERSGCRTPFTLTQTLFEDCEASKLGLEALLDSKFWQHRFYQPVDLEWQPTLFQPVGGMDQIVEGFLRQIGHLIHYESVVLKIQLLENGVEVTYRGPFAKEFRTRADYCISNIPLPVLQQIPANFSPEFKQAVDRGRFAPTCKVGWQANERFWESGKYQIYGGISFIDHLITQMWYPSYDYFTEKGTMTGAYNFEERAIELGKMSLEQRLMVAREGAIKLHPEFSDNGIVPQHLGLSIAWQNVPFQLGGWADWKSDDVEDGKAYTRLLAPDGRFYVVGDQVSPLPGWQEGAMMSAEHIIEQIAGMRPLTMPEILRAPDSRRMTQGRF